MWEKERMFISECEEGLCLDRKKDLCERPGFSECEGVNPTFIA
jgi:hypothetical protein